MKIDFQQFTNLGDLVRTIPTPLNMPPANKMSDKDKAMRAIVESALMSQGRFVPCYSGKFEFQAESFGHAASWRMYLWEGPIVAAGCFLSATDGNGHNDKRGCQKMMAAINRDVGRQNNAMVGKSRRAEANSRDLAWFITDTPTIRWVLLGDHDQHPDIAAVRTRFELAVCDYMMRRVVS